MIAEERREPYGDANVWSYSTIQHSLQEEMAVQTFTDPMDRALLFYLYGLKQNKWGLLDVVPEHLARLLDAPAADVNECLDALQRSGHVYRDKFYLILLNWRRYLGVDNAKRDAEGRLCITKGMAKIALSLWGRLTPEGQRRYLASCGVASKDELITIVERPDNRGGHNRLEQTQSKVKAKSKQSQSKAKANPEQTITRTVRRRRTMNKNKKQKKKMKIGHLHPSLRSRDSTLYMNRPRCLWASISWSSSISV